jgi:hypothetical protein
MAEVDEKHAVSSGDAETGAAKAVSVESHPSL